MARGSDQKGPAARMPHAATDGVVRAAKLIPPMVQSMPALKPLPIPDEDETMELPCPGRCGHCDCHPCRLHGPI